MLMRREIQNREGLLSIRAAAEYKQVTTKAVYRRIDAGHLPVMKVGEHLVVFQRDLDTWQVATNKQVQRPKQYKSPRKASA